MRAGAARGATAAARACCRTGPLSAETRPPLAVRPAGPARCSLLHGTCSPSWLATRHTSHLSGLLLDACHTVVITRSGTTGMCI